MLLAIVGLLIGCILGLTGAGGSILAVPLLMLLLGIAPIEAMGLALAVVGFSAIYGSFLQRKHVLWLPSLILACGGMLTAPLGKWGANQLPSVSLQIGFVLLSLIVAVIMFRNAASNQLVSRGQRVEKPAQTSVPCQRSPTGQFMFRYPCVSRLVWGGAGVGFVSGLFGVGGGFIIVPMLMFLSEVSLVSAVASSLVIISIVSLTGFMSYLMLGAQTDLLQLMPLLLFAVLGMVLSGFVAKKFTASLLQKSCAVLLFLVSLMSLL